MVLYMVMIATARFRGICLMTRAILFALSFGVVFLGVVIAIHLNFTMGVLIAVAGALYLLMEVN
jgi:hypothetical protein